MRKSQLVLAYNVVNGFRGTFFDDEVPSMFTRPITTRREALAVLGSAMFAAVGTPWVRGESFATNPPIKIGQIGVAHGHANKMSVYRSLPEYEVVGIVEPDPQLREKAKSDPVFRDLPWMTQEELLHVPGLQAVLVETRVRDLLNTAEACILADKHVHLDKPAGESLIQFERILAEAAQRKLLVQMGYMFRYNPAVVLLREFLRNGWLGDIFEVHAVMSKVVTPSARRVHAEYAGGMMFELGCHLMDLVVAMLGAPQSVASFSQRVSPLEDTLQDNMMAVLTYPRAIASIKSTAVEVDGGSRRHLVVCGTEGTFHIQPLDQPTVTLTLAKPKDRYQQGAQQIIMPKYDRYVDDALDMARILRGEKESDFTYAHDLLVQQTLLQACNLPAN